MAALPRCRSDLVKHGISISLTSALLVDEGHNACKSWRRRRRTSNAKEAEGPRRCARGRASRLNRVRFTEQVKAVGLQAVASEKRNVRQIPVTIACRYTALPGRLCVYRARPAAGPNNVICVRANGVQVRARRCCCTGIVPRHLMNIT